VTEDAKNAAPAAPEKKKAPPKVTAFALDGSVVGDVDAHPFSFGGFPGLWQVGRPMRASALGLTDAAMRDLIEKFNLPLLEVKVSEKNAYDTFPEDPNRIPSGAAESIAAPHVPDAPPETDAAAETGSEEDGNGDGNEGKTS